MSRFIIDTELDEVFELSYSEFEDTEYPDTKSFGSISALKKFVESQYRIYVLSVIRVTKLDNWRDM